MRPAGTFRRCGPATARTSCSAVPAAVSTAIRDGGGPRNAFWPNDASTVPGSRSPSRSTRSHWPTGPPNPPVIQRVPGSPSSAAYGSAPGSSNPGIASASDADDDATTFLIPSYPAVVRYPRQPASSGSAPRPRVSERGRSPVIVGEIWARISPRARSRQRSASDTTGSADAPGSSSSSSTGRPFSSPLSARPSSPSGAPWTRSARPASSRPTTSSAPATSNTSTGAYGWSYAPIASPAQPPHVLVAERRHPGDAGRGLQRLVHPRGPRAPQVGAGQVVADQQVPHAHPGEDLGEAGRAASGRHPLVDGVHDPRVAGRPLRDELPRPPPRPQQGLHDVVHRTAPGVVAEPRPGQRHHRLLARPAVQPLRRVLPVLGDGREVAGRRPARW